MDSRFPSFLRFRFVGLTLGEKLTLKGLRLKRKKYFSHSLSETGKIVNTLSKPIFWPNVFAQKKV